MCSFIRVSVIMMSFHSNRDLSQDTELGPNEQLFSYLENVLNDNKGMQYPWWIWSQICVTLILEKHLLWQVNVETIMRQKKCVDPWSMFSLFCCQENISRFCQQSRWTLVGFINIWEKRIKCWIFWKWEITITLVNSLTLFLLLIYFFT